MLLFDPKGIALIKVDGEPLVAIRATCRALKIDPMLQLARLRGARWARLRLVAVLDHLGRPRRVAVVPYASALLWVVGLDASQVGRRHRAWLEGLQAEAVESLDLMSV